MRSARAIAIEFLAPVRDMLAELGEDDETADLDQEDSECALASAIQQAREDGARWALEQIAWNWTIDPSTGEPKRVTVDPADVRKAAP